MSTDARRGLPACVPLWPWHRERLAEGGCSEEALATVERRALEALATRARPAPGRLRLSILVTPAGEVDARLSDRLSSLDVPGGPRIALVRVEAPPPLPRAAAKPAERAYWDDAMRRARPAQQAVLVGPDGDVLDGGTATVWALAGGRLVTPPAPPAVAGVARRFLLENASRLGVPVVVEPLLSSALRSAEEVFLTNALGGAVPARGRGGEVASRAAALFGEVWA
ncbi:MAG: aminotransferase class IV [Coriobacteriia bacterium]|nr:aminotransferase class IV [Coriobacteriia bacterium]